MSYQVIARKWRPQSFQELVGQEAIAQTLLNALKNDRLPHALLFTGTRGVGKTSSARILAKSLRCPEAVDFAPCNQCPVCIDINSGSSVDVIEIDGASNNGVEAIRELRDSVGYMPAHGKFKVYIIDEVHMLSTSAFNALLKTLEEPPAHVIFIFATTEAQKIPITVLSRCQRFDFRRIATRRIADHLAHICKTENIPAEAEALWIIARQADGSMRDGLSLLDQVITFCNGELSHDKVVSVLGLTDRQLLASCLDALVKQDTHASMKVVEQIFTAGYDAKIFAQDLLEEIRNLLIVKLNPQSLEQIVDVPESEIEKLKEFSEQLSQEDIHLLFDMALKGGADIPKAQNPRIVLEMILLRMAAAPRIHQLVAMSAGQMPMAEKKKPKADTEATAIESQVRVPAPTENNLEARESNIPEEETQNIPSPFPTYNETLSLEENWGKLVKVIKKHHAMLGAKLEYAIPYKMEDSCLTLAYPKNQNFICEQLAEFTYKDVFQEILDAAWGDMISEFDTILLKEETEQMSPKQIEDKRKQEAHEVLQQKINENEVVKATRNIFETELSAIRELKS